ncbi:unnamed protein product [Blepharisma stoltei]|uniref:Pre-SET domain-containing protein n=1 Tax=Blepharisma stoltei TaxID=1481888 RepID=A0AAU9JU91_9CILI|nr:unnamed protein product [Blepharisma stoltei]
MSDTAAPSFSKNLQNTLIADKTRYSTQISRNINPGEILSKYEGWVQYFHFSQKHSELIDLVKCLSLLTGLKSDYIFTYFGAALQNVESAWIPSEITAKLPNNTFITYIPKEETKANNTSLDRFKKPDKEAWKWAEEEWTEVLEIPPRFASKFKKLELINKNGNKAVIEYISNRILEPWNYIDKTDISKFNGEPAYFIPCNCRESHQNCSNSAHCSCSRSLVQTFRIQRCLTVKGPKKHFLPHKLSEDFRIIECSDQCNCNKDLCRMSLFSNATALGPEKFYVNETAQGQWELKCKIKLKRGQFLFELAGILRESQPEKNFLKLSDAHYLDFEATNISRFLVYGDKPNVIGIKIFSHVSEKWICRVGIFATRNIKFGEVLISSRSVLI